MSDLLAEADKRRYNDGVLRLLPLGDGQWAVYSHSMSVTVMAEPLDMPLLQAMSAQAEEYGRAQRARWLEAKQQPAVRKSDLSNSISASAEDLGL